MHNRHQVLHHLLLRREDFLIEYQQFTAMIRAKLCKPLEPKPDKAVFMGNDERFDCTRINGLHQGDKLLARAMKSPAHFANDFYIC